jgi:hypothetical protein
MFSDECLFLKQSHSYTDCVPLQTKPRIANHMPTETLLPLDGFWGACENFRIFIRVLNEDSCLLGCSTM